MKILIPCIIDLYKSAPNRPHHLIKYLSKDHDITAICINDWWKGEQVNSDIYFENFRESLDSITIHYITNKKISPIKQELFASKLINLDILDEEYDVIFNYNTLNSGRHLAKKLDIPMIYDIADDLPEMIAHSPQIPSFFRPFGRWYGRYLLDRNIQLAKKITATSPVFKELYSISDDKFELIPNGVDTDLFRKMDSTIRKELGLEKSFVLGYVGVLREWIDFTPVLEAMKELPDTKLLIVGEEGRLNATKNLVHQMGLDERVVFTGTVPYMKVPEYIAAMDVCLLPFKKNAISDNAVPLKLFEYLACEKPVISPKLKSIQILFKNELFYADNSMEFEENLKKLINNENNVSKEIFQGNFIENNYNWKRICNKIEIVINDFQS